MKPVIALVTLLSVAQALPLWPGLLEASFQIDRWLPESWVSYEQFVLKTGPTEFELATEEIKLRYRRNNKKFIDVTNQISVADAIAQGLIGNNDIMSKDTHLTAQVEVPKYKYPVDLTRNSKKVKQLLSKIDIDKATANLVEFSSFYTRYYKSESGLESAKWLFNHLTDLVEPVKDKVSIYPVQHDGWDQFSIIVSIPGSKSTDKVVVGAHQDSANLILPNLTKAPGADDDGSGTVTTLEALRVLIDAYVKGDFKPRNTLEFHYYSAEEGGLKGSIDVFNQYHQQNETVVAMLQQDMTGYTAGSLAEGIEPHFGLINDYTSVELNDFLKLVIAEYCEIPYHETECGYACSDHASALENGYPASFLIESEFKYTNKYIHSVLDTIDRLDFDHIAEHIKLTIAYAYELSVASHLY